MNETYQRVIPLLSQSLGWRAICFQIASKHPETFLEAYCATHEGDIETRAKQAVIDALDGTKANKIRAMKAYRELTKADLLTSKNFVESVIDELRLDF